jgi:hypothetical protein
MEKHTQRAKNITHTMNKTRDDRFNLFPPPARVCKKKKKKKEKPGDGDGTHQVFVFSIS